MSAYDEGSVSRVESTENMDGVDRLPSGRWRIRWRDGGRRKSKVFDTRDEALRVLNAVRYVLWERYQAAQSQPKEVTLRTHGAWWLDRRELAGHRAIETDRSFWRVHVLESSIADVPVKQLDRRALKDWLEKLSRKEALQPQRGPNNTTVYKPSGRKIAWQTVKHAVNLVKSCLGDLVENGTIAGNPADKLTVKRTGRTEEEWTHLTLAEIRQVLTSPRVTDRERLLCKIAIYTGLRQGELWGLHWDDVHLDGDRPHVVVRFSHKGPPKNGKIRHVPLLEPALEAFREWSKISQENGKNLVFCNRSGEHHDRGYDGGWADVNVPVCRQKPGKPKVKPGIKTRAGIIRHVRFHDLRHTCASHLVMGSWGIQWTLHEIAAFLGHSDVEVTQRYAHLSPDHLHRKASQTARRDPSVTGGSGSRGESESEESTGKDAARPTRLELVTLSSVGRIEQQQYQALRVPDDPLVTHAKKLLTEVLQGHEIQQEALDALLAEAMPYYPTECTNALRSGVWKLRRVIELAGVVIGSVGVGEARRG